jgi:hypothetical protein
MAKQSRGVLQDAKTILNLFDDRANEGQVCYTGIFKEDLQTDAALYLYIKTPSDKELIARTSTVTNGDHYAIIDIDLGSVTLLDQDIVGCTYGLEIVTDIISTKIYSVANGSPNWDNRVFLFAPGGKNVPDAPSKIDSRDFTEALILKRNKVYRIGLVNKSGRVQKAQINFLFFTFAREEGLEVPPHLE